MSSSLQKERKIPSCGFCGRRLGSEYYYTCMKCGKTFCYVHTDKHTH